MGRLRVLQVAALVTATFEISTTAHANDHVHDLKFEVAVPETPLLTDRQVVKLDAPELRERFVDALNTNGFALARRGYDRLLTVDVTAFDSGNYLGGAKTATMTIQYKLVDGAGAPIDHWVDACQFRAKLDFQSSPSRNVTAVNGCLKDMIVQLVGHLRGNAGNEDGSPPAR